MLKASMRLTLLSVACPQCGSTDVLYSCKPECCYNHVCNGCYTTFELETTRVGEVTEDFDPPPDPDPTGPTAPCARCREPRVFAVGDGSQAPQYVCANCKALLTLALTEIAPA
jgi:transposase-like protein